MLTAIAILAELGDEAASIKRGNSPPLPVCPSKTHLRQACPRRPACRKRNRPMCAVSTIAAHGRRCGDTTFVVILSGSSIQRQEPHVMNQGRHMRKLTCLPCAPS